MTAAMIEVDRLTFAYGGRPALFEGFSLAVGQGDSLAVIGPSGCGKSTLLYRLGARIRSFYGPDGRHAPEEKLDRAAALARVDGWLERLGILEFADQYPSQLSRGQRQRAAIARTLSLEPDLLLMDEPFSALDAPTRADLLEIIGRTGPAAGLTRVLVTHDIDEAVQFGQRILVLHRGVNREALVLVGEPAEGPGERETEGRTALRARLIGLLEGGP
jgi:ABC-type nitrate/sulfonate/bicarbonate transport system ATPase subunit